MHPTLLTQRTAQPVASVEQLSGQGTAEPHAVPSRTEANPASYYSGVLWNPPQDCAAASTRSETSIDTRPQVCSARPEEWPTDTTNTPMYYSSRLPKASGMEVACCGKPNLENLAGASTLRTGPCTVTESSLSPPLEDSQMLEDVCRRLEACNKKAKYKVCSFGNPLPSCPHCVQPLQFMTDYPDSYPAGGILCNLCSQTVAIYGGFFHCEGGTCQYDLCLRCHEKVKTSVQTVGAQTGQATRATHENPSRLNSGATSQQHHHLQQKQQKKQQQQQQQQSIATPPRSQRCPSLPMTGLTPPRLPIPSLFSARGVESHADPLSAWESAAFGMLSSRSSFDVRIAPVGLRCAAAPHGLSQLIGGGPLDASTLLMTADIRTKGSSTTPVRHSL